VKMEGACDLTVRSVAIPSHVITLARNFRSYDCRSIKHSSVLSVMTLCFYQAISGGSGVCRTSLITRLELLLPSPDPGEKIFFSDAPGPNVDG
jgi:hypothetical protein